jgi:LCP family protein required for cell wall assembly
VPDPTPPSPYTRKRGHAVSSLVGIVVVTQVVVALLTAGVVYVGWRHLDGNLTAGAKIQHPRAKTIPQQDRNEDHEPLNILVLGTDSRAGAGDAIDGERGCNCSDSTILVHVSADRRSAYGVSIPRDALVKPVACTRDVEYLDTGLVEWNAAFSAGGAACTAEQLEKDFHVYVDDYVVVDFSGFKNMVSAIGGVDVCIPFELSDPTYAKVTFQPGPSVHLDGPQALAYVRLRHVLAGTDIGRIKRQQVFVSALVDKLVSTGTLTRPDRLFRFADALTKSITTNPELAHVRALMSLAGEFRHIDLDHIRFVTMPNRLYDAPVGDPYWGRVEILPPAYRLMRLVDQDEPLGAFRKGSVAAGQDGKRPSEQAKAAAAAAGICA